MPQPPHRLRAERARLLASPLAIPTRGAQVRIDRGGQRSPRALALGSSRHRPLL